MKQIRRIAIAVCLLALGAAPSAQATDISGTIATTLTIYDNSRLVGDVTCTVTGAPCIAFGAPGLTLKLNGFTMTGRANLQTPCATPGPGEVGIDITSLADDVILGPGIVQGFRQFGIRLRGATGATVKRVTANSNCSSGIFVNSFSPAPGTVLLSTDNDIVENTTVRNGSPTVPCGGI